MKAKPKINFSNLVKGSLVKLKTRQQIKYSQKCKYWHYIGYVDNLLDFGSQIIKLHRVTTYSFEFYDNDWISWEFPYQMIDSVISYKKKVK